MAILKNTKLSFFILTCLILGYLRFANLSYSDFSTDETPVMGPIKDNANILSLGFLFKQYKGPMQFLVSQVIENLGISVFDELGFRFVFALLGTLSFGIFYLYMHKLTKNHIVSFICALLLGANGFTVGLTRIVQYQSLNLFFTMLALLFYQSYFETKKLKYQITGTILICLSILSHWDALLAFPILLYYFIKKINIRHFFVNVLLGSAILLPFLIPYIINTFQNTTSIGYLNARVGIPALPLAERLEYFNFFIRLYNPFVFVQFFVFGILICVFAIKKHLAYFLWLAIEVCIFVFFVKRSGTHIYNVLIPFNIILGLVLADFYKYLNKYLKVIPSILFLGFVGFFWYQSYLLFVDYSKEYPWQTEIILSKYQTQEYTSKTLTNNIVGFPHNRYWKEARVQLENMFPDYKSFTYETNERRDSANYYLELEPGISERMFIFEIKTPINFATDYKISVKNKKEILKFKNDFDRTVNTVQVVQ